MADNILYQSVRVPYPEAIQANVMPKTGGLPKKGWIRENKIIFPPMSDQAFGKSLVA
jgi:hypothetical protein